MIIALWIVTALLAIAFGFAGIMKATRKRAELAAQMPWTEDVSDSQLRAIGIVEFLGAVGLILPMALGILPWLTPLAAFGLFITMIAAAVLHVRRGEAGSLPVNIVLGLLALLVGIGWLFQL
ncbi:MAG: DoxX family protein [Leifsonia sp.]